MQSGMNIQVGLVMAARCASRHLLGVFLANRFKAHTAYTERTCNAKASQMLHQLGGMAGEW